MKLIKIGNHSGDKKRKPTHKKHSINKMRSQYKYDGDDVIGEGGFGKVLAGRESMMVNLLLSNLSPRIKFWSGQLYME